VSGRDQEAIRHAFWWTRFQNTDRYSGDRVLPLRKLDATKRLEEDSSEPGSYFWWATPRKASTVSAGRMWPSMRPPRIASCHGGKVERLTENFRTVGGFVEWSMAGPKLFEGNGISYQALNASRKREDRRNTSHPLGLQVPIPEGSEDTKAFTANRKRSGSRPI